MLRYAEQVGWRRLSRSEADGLRGGPEHWLLRQTFEQQLRALNPAIITDARTHDVLRRLSLIPPTIAGNQEALEWLRGRRSVFVDDDNREREVRLIDFENVDGNVFHVTDEWRQKSAVHTNRADVVFLINGIPVAVAETKGASKPNAIAEGVEQIRRYHEQTPEMFIAPQVFEVTQMLGFFYGVTWSTSRKGLFNWRDDAAKNYEAKVKAFFDRERFLRVLRDYIVFQTRDDQLVKMVLRQHQTRAVEKVVERANDPARRRGLVWHTQGSGKTLTMLTVAQQLLTRRASGEKPTVLMLIDRNELEDQLARYIQGLGINDFQVAASKADLRAILRRDYRGLVVSMIHKFDDIDAGLVTRDSVIVLVDEAHRTTGGHLGNYLMAALPNATYIGFTGTPIDRLSQGKGTFKVFGGDDPQGYLDKYSIAESIQDGTTVQLNYALAHSGLRVDRQMLDEEFLGLAEAQGVSDVDELNAILGRAVKLKEAMKAPERVEKVAKHVVKHFTENVEPMGFKAMLVAVDREACTLYKRALDDLLPPEQSAVVYSPAHNDTAALREFHLSEDDEKRVRGDFRQKSDDPKILIVTEKLLTGFDAPILYCMYLDKPMRDHVLLQAIARVNRPYEDDDGLVKPYGLVFDFVGIFEDLEKALAFDSDVVGSVIKNIDVLKELFRALMGEQAADYLPLTTGWDDKAKEAALAHFEDTERREGFFEFFRTLQNIYDILSPDAFLRPFIDDFVALAELYALVRSAYSDRVYVDKELVRKTKQLLRDHTHVDAMELPGAIHALSAEELAKLRNSGTSTHTKVLNLKKVLGNTVRAGAGGNPYLISIGELAQEIVEQYENRQLSTEEALRRFEELAETVVDAEAEREGLGITPNAYAVYITLKQFTDVDAASAETEAIDECFGRFPDYRWSADEERKLRLTLYRALSRVAEGNTTKIIEVADALMGLDRI
jgi:type I restriction enzyme, R subunit